MSYQPIPTNDSEPDTLTSSPSSLLNESDSSISSSSPSSSTSEGGEYFIKIVLVGSPSITHHCSPQITMGELKHRVFSTELSQNKDIKLIYLGKIIASDAISLEQLGVECGYALHAFISDKPLASSSMDDLPPSNNNDNGSDSYHHQQQQILVYHDNHGNNAEYDAEMAERLYFIRMRNDYGTNADLLLGFLMGMILGVLSVFWLCTNGVPYRQKVGIVTGLGAYLVLSYFNRGIVDDPIGRANRDRQGATNDSRSSPVVNP